MNKAKEHDLLFDLQLFLKSACHAPGCDTIARCPDQCKCRTKRTFKTNTETAICWELANQIFNYLRGERQLVKHKLKLQIYASAYSDLARYHMTEGWNNFYKNAYVIIRMIFNPNDYYTPDLELHISHRFMEMKYSINRLKREPKG